jgi:primosomal protein N' (replication factor Y)
MTGALSFSEQATQFVEVILPVPIHKLFTYRLPRELDERIKTGVRVIVPFGSRRILTGVVERIHTTPPREYEAKYVLEVLDETEIISNKQVQLYHWMAGYYMCSIGEVLNAAMPSGLKLSSESMIQLHPSFDEEGTQLEFSEKESIVLRALKEKPLPYTDVAAMLGVKNIYGLVRSLSAKDAIILFEAVKEKYRPKKEKRIRLKESFASKKAMEKMFHAIEGKPKQEAVLLKYLQLVPVFHNADLNKTGVKKSHILDEEISESSLATLVRNKILEEFEVVVPRFDPQDVAVAPPLLLSEKQEKARNEILTGFDAHGTVLLMGVTGSGKTEIYIDLIRRAIEGGSQVLYLLPEIALTTQIVQRLQRTFGSAMGIYHSRFSDAERVEVWNGILLGKFKFVVGVRSAVFLPFDNLGLIIVDEEHDPSYKQHEPSPRYHARDVALVMGQHHNAKVILGSATPSTESWYNSKAGKFQLVKLDERFGAATLPDIVFADQLKERRQKSNKGDFSSILLREIKDTLKNKNQVILFQNRRGYAPVVQCEDCRWIPRCVNCDVSLTYHQFSHALVCHYCGFREDLPKKCPVCESRRILTMGYGTEKLEEDVQTHFEEAKIKRMDYDTTRTKGGYEALIDSFQDGETDILVGTQMVTKGLDFDRVSLVGIFDADRMMHFPDFRSYERAFQLITQVSGRAGRRETKGRVVIQTFNSAHELFGFVKTNNQTGFLEWQLRDREEHFYPPYSRLIQATIKHTDVKIAAGAALIFTNLSRTKITQARIFGPGDPMVNRIRNEYLKTVLFKIPRNQGKLPDIKEKLLAIAHQVNNQKEFRQVKIQFDVDPV